MKNYNGCFLIGDQCTMGQQTGKKEESATWSKTSLKLPSTILKCRPSPNIRTNVVQNTLNFSFKLLSLACR